jgi:hypothetical protein
MASLLLAEGLQSAVSPASPGWGGTLMWQVQLAAEQLDLALLLFEKSRLTDGEPDYLATGLLVGDSDGRHLAAISEAGELIWLRNPWEDKPAFCPYRTPRPIISHIESIEFNEVYANNLKSRGVNLSHAFLYIQFDLSQYGVIDESSGDFIPEGQN